MRCYSSASGSNTRAPTLSLLVRYSSFSPSKAPGLGTVPGLFERLDAFIEGLRSDPRRPRLLVNTVLSRANPGALRRVAPVAERWGAGLYFCPTETGVMLDNGLQWFEGPSSAAARGTAADRRVHPGLHETERPLGPCGRPAPLGELTRGPHPPTARSGHARRGRLVHCLRQSRRHRDLLGLAAAALHAVASAALGNAVTAVR